MKRRAAIPIGFLIGALAVVASGVLAPGTVAARTPPVERVLVLSLPVVTWSDLDEGETPHLDRLLAQSAVADLSTRAPLLRTNRADGYVMLGAGARAEGTPLDEGLGFGVEEPYGADPAGLVFERRTGERLATGIVNLLIAEIVDGNDALLYGAEVGALGDALDRAGIARAVIANADVDEVVVPPTQYQRQAVSALMDHDGVVPEGAVGPELLLADPAAPYGLRYDPDAVEVAFRSAWEQAGDGGSSDGRTVVLVEASDLVRYDLYRDYATPERRAELRRSSLEDTDALVGRLLARVDPERDAVIVVGPAPPTGDDELTVAALRSAGTDPGLLRSPTTRRDGFVQLVDVAPTVLDLLDVEIPSAMEGRPFEVDPGSGSFEERRAFLIEENDDAVFRDGQLTPATTVFVAANVLIVAATAWALLRAGRRRAWLRALGWFSLAILGFLPATYVAQPFPFSDWGVVAYWSFLLGVAVAIATLVSVGFRRDVIDPLAGALGVVVAVVALDVVTGAHLQLNTVFGYSPTVAGRFAGVGNSAFAAMTSSAVLLAALLAHRLGRPRGPVVASLLLLAVLVVEGVPFWGADVGGVLACVPAFALTAALLFGWRPRVRLRWVVVGALGAVAALGGFAVLDLARPSAERTHLGRLVERIGDDGLSALTEVAQRKGLANLAVLTSSVWLLMVPVTFAFIAYLVYRAPGRLREIQERIPALRAALAGLLVLGVLGFALNDSGISIPGLMLGVLNASLVYLATRLPPGGTDPVPRPGAHR